MGIAAAGARLLLRGVRPGDYPRGGSVHLRLWSAERLADAVDATNLAGAPWIAYYARALGATVGRGVTLHTVPPITGMLTLGRDCSVEPEVDLSGYWLDGDVLRLGADHGSVPGPPSGRAARSARVPRSVGAPRSPPVPGCPARFRDGERWAGAPAVRVGRAGTTGPPPAAAQAGVGGGYGLTSLVLSLLPVVAALPGLLLAGRRCARRARPADASRRPVAARRSPVGRGRAGWSATRC